MIEQTLFQSAVSAVANESPGLKMPGVVPTPEAAMPAFVPVITVRPAPVIVGLIVVTLIGIGSVVVMIIGEAQSRGCAQ
jgi:hypothetical protein